MPDLILISGLPGTGKTTLAKAFCKTAHARHFNSDLVRQALGLRGHYRPEEKARVYAALLEKTREALQNGQTVVVDSTFYLETIRQPFRQLAFEAGAALHWIEVCAAEGIVRERVGQSRPDSEADYAVYQKIKSAFEPLTDPHLVLWADRQPLSELVGAVQHFIGREMPHATAGQVDELVAAGRFPGRGTDITMLETHISRVILTPDFAFKLKKPLRLPFLDFRTTEQRRHFCEEELRLNRRLAPDVYLGVLPVGSDASGHLRIGDTVGQPLDYAVQMKRLDNRYQMDKLLAENAVSRTDMDKLGRLLARFHAENSLPPQAVDYRPGDAFRDFEGLFELETTAENMLGAYAGDRFRAWQSSMPPLLAHLEPLILARIRQGCWVDGHGDLHARNIFLLPDAPVVFDCIEFNPHFRKIDCYSDLAFLCMDLDANDQPELAAQLMNTYNGDRNFRLGSAELALFLFYKAYRANVRLKVALLEWQQHREKPAQDRGGRYFNLLEKYMTRLARRAYLT